MWEILKSQTDEEHPMSTNELIQKLNEEGIQVDRKILYADIELLNENGYEVLTERARSNLYYVEDRSFYEHEVRILMDAVKSAAFITEKKTDELINKIAMLAGSKRGKLLKENITKFPIVKANNEMIYYSVDPIVQAIKKKRKIGFNYSDYNVKRERVYRMDKENPNQKRWYVVNPVTTFVDNGQYYLTCYDDKHGGSLANYRIDRMDKVKILEQDITPNPDIDIAKYKRQQFSMFGGDVKKVEFEIDKSKIDVVFDKFGNGVKMREDNGKIRCAVEVQESPTFISWCCSFDKSLKVLSPPSTIEKIKKHLKLTLEMYE
jgi:predicted DNA-binding transcriptional regulator YafY